MSSPELALQGALVTALKATGGVGTAQRVFDSVPAEDHPSFGFPYIRVGDDQVLGDDDDCEDLSEVFSRIHVWSRAAGWPEAKTIAAAIRTRVKAATLTLSGFTVDNVEFVQSLFLEDPDGISRHAVVEFRFLITHA
jgi:hypothetical protein